MCPESKEKMKDNPRCIGGYGDYVKKCPACEFQATCERITRDHGDASDRQINAFEKAIKSADLICPVCNEKVVAKGNVLQCGFGCTFMMLPWKWFMTDEQTLLDVTHLEGGHQ